LQTAAGHSILDFGFWILDFGFFKSTSFSLAQLTPIPNRQSQILIQAVNPAMVALILSMKVKG